MATKFSKYFTLEQLTITDQKTKNKPSENVIANLRILAETLDLMYEKIGPFTILSAYRSQETQDSLKSGGSTQAISASLHTKGLASDIVPKKMSAIAYMAKIAQTPAISKRLGGYALKSTAIHLDVDTSKRNAVPLKVMKDGSYVRLTTDEVKKLISQYPIASKSLMISFLGASLALVYWFYFRRANSSRD
jgi:hypothetical protein